MRRTAADCPDWPSLVEQQKQSGLTQKAFCAKQGIALSAFGYWKRRIEQQETAIEICPPQFIELDMHRTVLPRPTHEDLVVELPFGVVMRFRTMAR